MNCIVAVDQNWGIGKDDRLLVHIPADLKYFKQKTLNRTVIMGRKTLLTLPNQKPLVNRHNIILTTQDIIIENATVCHFVQEVLDIADKDSYVIGGSSIYTQFLPYIDTCYVTKIYDTFQATHFFPNLDKDTTFTPRAISDIQQENGVSFQFFVYTRNKSS